MRSTVHILLLTLLVSCSIKSEKGIGHADAQEFKPALSSHTLNDTTNTAFTVQIGNEKGIVKIVGIRTFQHEKLIHSDFIISLNNIGNYSIFKQIDKSMLIDSNKTVLLKDTLNGDFLKSAVIKTVTFDFVRSNALYFKAVLENPLENKEILGRFNLFYRTNKKGMIYGWITDEIKETLPETK